MSKVIKLKAVVKFLLLFIICSVHSISYAQGKYKLSIGDKAPSIYYSKWFKGTPFHEFTEDKTYVLEFWATWCGPCRAAMPHLSELAKKYENTVRFIGVNVLEETGGKPYASATQKVSDFVNSGENAMTYDVIMDNNGTDMNKQWLRAAGVLGIPSTFVIDKGKVVWIGHPMKLDSILQEISDGKYDINANKLEHEASSNRIAGVLAAFNALKKKIDDAVAGEDYDRAIAIIDSSASVPKSSVMLGYYKFEILLNHFSEKEAMAFLTGDGKKNPYLPLAVPELIASKDGLSEHAYKYAIEKLEEQKPTNSKNASLIAMAMSKTDQFAQAIAYQEKALELAKTELGNPKFKNITEETIAMYQGNLEMYKKNLSKTK